MEIINKTKFVTSWLLILMVFLFCNSSFAQKNRITEKGYLLFTPSELIFFPNKNACSKAQLRDLEKSEGKKIWGADYSYLVSADSGKEYIVEQIYERNDTVITHFKNQSYKVVPVKVTYVESLFNLGENGCMRILCNNKTYNICLREDLDITIEKNELIR